jgi:hypothetical protein
LVIQIHIMSPDREGHTLIICILKMTLDLHNSQEHVVYVSMIDTLYCILFVTVLELSRTMVCWSSQEPWYALTVFEPSEQCYLTAFPTIDISDWITQCRGNYLIGSTNHSQAVNTDLL